MDNEQEMDFSAETDESQIETLEDQAQEEESKPVRKEESLEDRKARLERQLAQTNKKLGLDVEKPIKKTSKKSEGLDYAQKAYLAANGIKGAAEFEFVEKELKSSNLDIDSLLENGYFQSQLEKFRAIAKTNDANPKDRDTRGGSTDSIEYWMSKPIEEVPAEMRTKIVNAKLQKEKVKGVFYNS